MIDEEDEEEEEEEEEEDDDDDDDDDNKALWCSSGWSCYNYDIDALLLLSALSRKRRHADHSEV